MTRAIVALLLSSAFALSACQNGLSANNAVTTEDLNATSVNETATGVNATAGVVDQQFVTDGIKSDTAEVAIGQLAASKGSTQAVKDLGNMLATDHGAHKQKLIDLANGAGITVPTEPAEEGHANLLKLQKLTGTEFDRTLAQMLVDSHNKGIAKNEAQAKSGDAQTAQLANDTLPTLRKHLAAAEALLK